MFDYGYTERTAEIFIGNYKRYIHAILEFFNSYFVYETLEDMHEHNFYAIKYLWSVFPIDFNPTIDEFIEASKSSFKDVIDYHKDREKKRNWLKNDKRERVYQCYQDVELLLKSGFIITTRTRSYFNDEPEDSLEELISHVRETLNRIDDKTGIKKILWSDCVYSVIFH